VKPGVNLWSRVLIYNRPTREREREFVGIMNSSYIYYDLELHKYCFYLFFLLKFMAGNDKFYFNSYLLEN